MDTDIANAEILIVDATDALVEAFRLAPLAGALRVRAVRGLREAESAISATAPELILIDTGLSSEPAFETCRRLHASPATATTPLILVGRFDTATEIARGGDSGAVDFLNPPLLPALLMARIQVHLAAARARAELQRAQAARRHAEDDSRAAHRASSDLLASMGHEIRTPMTAILGMSHLALQSGLTLKQRNYVEKVERSAELLLGTLNDILDYARIGADTLELQRGPFEIADVFDSLARLVGLQAEDKGLELLFELPPDLPTRLIGDGARLTQVLVNLGQDALLAADHGEVVIGIETVARTPQQTMLRFWVRSAGAAPRAERAPQGADLGAAVSRELIRLMGGELVALASPPAPGHAVYFTIGFEVPAGAGALALAPTPASTRVLVVDDNATARRIMVGMAAELGLQADAARDGWDALRLVSQAQRAGRPYDLVLLDWKMPGMDGVECARQLMAGQPQPPAILMITAFGQHDAMQQLDAQRVVVRGVLAKPLTPAVLREALAAALRRPMPEGASPADREQALRMHGARLRGARILLVEDNAIIQELALELLTGAGMLVSVAENGREALALLAKQRFDGVLMDCQMPVLDGYETTRALRALPPLQNLPVIALTANPLDGERERVLAAGMNDHIAKPLDVALMFETLARWVQPPVAAESAAPPDASVPSDDDPLARLPGIDARVGRSSTMNNDKLYRRLLGMFVDGQREFAAQFRAARAAADEATAMRLAHNLRAVSASLGALAVQHSAGALERACADKAADDVVAARVAQVEADLAPVMRGLAVLPR
jgi:CheY-like chemotaxis protein/HPt (histidine-containing phosphotransfer) domain-containing protein